MARQYTHEENRVAFYTAQAGTKKTTLIVVEKSADHNWDAIQIPLFNSNICFTVTMTNVCLCEHGNDELNRHTHILGVQDRTGPHKRYIHRETQTHTVFPRGELQDLRAEEAC